MKTTSHTNKHMTKSLQEKESQQDALTLSALADTIVTRHQHPQTTGRIQGYTRSCASESAKEPYISAIEPYISINKSYISAKGPYLYEKEPYLYAKEQYVTAREPCQTRLDQREVEGGGGNGRNAEVRRRNGSCNTLQRTTTRCNAQ